MDERGVLLDILSHLGENEEAFPSQETIASNLGISESTVKSAVTALEKKGYIKTVRRRGYVNRYRVKDLESNPYTAYSEVAHYFKNMQEEILIFGVKLRGLRPNKSDNLEDIIDAPGDFVKVTNDRGITFLEKKLPDGRGGRLNQDGMFKGFIDQ